MRLGDRFDPTADLARALLRQTRAWIGRRLPRLVLTAILLLAVAGIGVIIGLSADSFSSAIEDPTLVGPSVAPAKTMVHALGMDPGDTFLILSGIRKVNVGLPAHMLQGALSRPGRIDLDIKELDYQRLAYEREVALQQGIWMPSDEDYVPVTIRYVNQTLHGRARLKGDWPDHWYGEKWSLRFKLDSDDHLDHMSEFALQAPRTRNYMAEWLFQQTLAREGLSGLSYGFVDVTINGKSMGTYAIEEAFDDGITWYNREPPGPLLRFTDTQYFEFWATTNTAMPEPHLTALLDAFGGNATKAGYSENETKAALRLLELWRSGEAPARDVFDIDRTARYLALSDLLGNIHGNVFHNIRFYYNPITARLEIVGHDANAGQVLEELRCVDPDPYYRLLFDDPIFTERYLTELERISADGYLEDLFAELEPGIQANVSIIYRDQPFYNFMRQTYFDNRATIRAALHPSRAINAYVMEPHSERPVVELGAAQPLPVEVTAMLVDGVRAMPIGGPVLLPGKVLHNPVQFRTVVFALPSGATWNASVPMEVECRVIGTEELRLESVVPTPRLPGAAEAGAVTRLPANTENLSFAVTDDARRTVYLLQGSHRLVEPLIVPEGYTLRCGPNTSLDLVRNASIVARGPLDWVGTEERPITIRSNDGTGGGVVVLRARNLSTLVNVRFEPLASPGAAQGPGAAMTFLESPATLVGVSMKGDRTAPLLRLVASPFNVTGSVFVGGASPAVSLEYSPGDLIGARVANGSGLRVSGSPVRLERCHFEGITGTSIQVERGSVLSGSGVICTVAGTALASESGSTASLDGFSVRDADVGVHAGRGETGFEPGSVTLSRANHLNVTTVYVEEDGGVIMIDGERPEP